MKARRGSHSEPQAENTNEPAEASKTKREGNREARLAIVGAAVAALAAGFAAWQGWEMRKTRIEGGQAATDALYISERAYLAVGTISIFCPICDRPQDIRVPEKFPVEANATYLVNVMDYGRTPADIIEMNFTRWSSSGHRLAADFDFSEDPRRDWRGAYLAPDPNNPLQVKLYDRAESIVSARGQVPTQRSGNESAAKYLYIYGHITYADIFKHRHVLLFCREYIGPSETIPETWSRCPTHEGEDDSFMPKKLAFDDKFALPEHYAPEPPDNRPVPLREMQRKMQQPTPPK